MIEVVIREYLAGKLNVPVLMEKPEDGTKQYVLIEKTGAGRSNYIQDATFAIQSYGETMYEAAALSEEVKTAMIGDGRTNWGITAEEDISRCELNSEYNFTDTESKEYRYQAIFDLYF